MSATRQPAPSFRPSYFGSPKRGAPQKRRVHGCLKYYSFISFPGESMFWQPRPQHLPLQEQLGNRFPLLQFRGR